MEDLAGLDTVADEFGSRGLDVGDDQVQALGRAGCGRREARAELDAAVRTRRRELDDAEAVTGGDIGVKSPAEAQVELLGPVGIRDGDDHRLELLVHDVCSDLFDVPWLVLTPPWRCTSPKSTQPHQTARETLVTAIT